MTARRNWKPLQPSTVEQKSYREGTNVKYAQEVMARNNCTFDEAVAQLEEYDRQCSYWINDLYQVQMREFYCTPFEQQMVHLNIRRRDGAAVFDWRHRQWIKNQLVGAECEGMELYPAESRLSDSCNKYHLWVFKDPEVRIPVGMVFRDVVENEVAGPPGLRQRRV